MGKTSTTSTTSSSESNHTLLFSEYAWTKIKWFMKKAGKLEMSGFGITSAKNPLYVEDFQTILQECTPGETLLEDQKLALFVGEMAKKKIDPCRCMRVWIHTHPFATTTPKPSGTDVDTFTGQLGEGDWAIMVIFGRGMCVTAQLRTLTILPGVGTIEIPLCVKHEVSTPIEDANGKKWGKEFKAHIHEQKAIEVVTVPHQQKNGRAQNYRNYGNYRNYRNYRNYGKSHSSSSFFDYGEELPIARFEKEWTNNNQVRLPLSMYTLAKIEGYSTAQIILWGQQVFYHTPATPTKLYFKHLVQDTSGNPQDNQKKDKQKDKQAKARKELLSL